MADSLVLVDGDDRRLGLGDKAACHEGAGRLHRAFTALVLDGGGRLLLTRRSAGKPLWPGCWDGTFASHPRDGEAYAAAAERRMPEELGISCGMEYLFKFEYHVPYGAAGSENEVCGTLIGTAGGEPAPVAGEVSEARWATAAELRAGVAADPAAYCPWMLIALHLLPGAAAARGGALGPWADPGTGAAMLEAARRHLPDDRWRLLPG